VLQKERKKKKKTLAATTCLEMSFLPSSLILFLSLSLFCYPFSSLFPVIVYSFLFGRNPRHPLMNDDHKRSLAEMTKVNWMTSKAGKKNL
jgi:hypothetical protein